MGVTILVVAVPEGLPLAITLSLSFSIQRMLDDKNFVKHLDACETMGSATTILCDKTGTLTTNCLTVVQGYMGKTHFSEIQTLPLSDTSKAIIAESISVNSSMTTSLNGKVVTGNKVEGALFLLLQDLNINYQV